MAGHADGVVALIVLLQSLEDDLPIRPLSSRPEEFGVARRRGGKSVSAQQPAACAGRGLAGTPSSSSVCVPAASSETFRRKRSKRSVGSRAAGNGGTPLPAAAAA